MLINSYSQTSFTAKSPLPNNLKQVRRIFNSEFKDIKSPSQLERLSGQPDISEKDLKELNNRLNFVRGFLRQSYCEDGLCEAVRGVIGCVKAFKVANCGEMSEIGKFILKMNGIKNCDIFSLYAKNSRGEIRSLDHAIIALKVPKSKNNKLSKFAGNIFEPKNGTPILDLWLHGLIGKIGCCEKNYKEIGLNEGERLMFHTLNTLEPDIETIKYIRKTFPKLVFKD